MFITYFTVGWTTGTGIQMVGNKQVTIYCKLRYITVALEIQYVLNTRYIYYQLKSK